MGSHAQERWEGMHTLAQIVLLLALTRRRRVVLVVLGTRVLDQTSRCNAFASLQLSTVAALGLGLAQALNCVSNNSSTHCC